MMACAREEQSLLTCSLLPVSSSPPSSAPASTDSHDLHIKTELNEFKISLDPYRFTHPTLDAARWPIKDLPPDHPLHDRLPDIRNWTDKVLNEFNITLKDLSIHGYSSDFHPTEAVNHPLVCIVPQANDKTKSWQLAATALFDFFNDKHIGEPYVIIHDPSKTWEPCIDTVTGSEGGTRARASWKKIREEMERTLRKDISNNDACLSSFSVYSRMDQTTREMTPTILLCYLYPAVADWPDWIAKVEHFLKKYKITNLNIEFTYDRARHPNPIWNQYF